MWVGGVVQMVYRTRKWVFADGIKVLKMRTFGIIYLGLKSNGCNT
jgi:hypothetical protein